MAGYVEGWDRRQTLLLPEYVDENPVRVVDAFVDHLDLAELGVGHATPADNRGGGLVGNFELMMDLIFHENSPNKQIKLANRLDLPDTDSNKLTKTNTDPPHT